MSIRMAEAVDKWDEISGGMSAWEQRAIWAAIWAEAIFVAAVTVCICKMYCSILKQKNGPNGLVAVEGSYSGLRDRVLDLEANLLMNGRQNTPSIEQESSADIEAAD